MASTMLLNEQYSFSDVRYQITSNSAYERGYDVELSFIDYPDKILLEPGTALVRLDFPVAFGLFTAVWWMRSNVLKTLLQSADSDSTALRREWQHQTAMPKASKGFRTQVIEIELTAPVYAWIGKASPLFNKTGGAEQVYLPNLARGAGPNRSDYARLRHTYTLPVL
jgi:hypothetical protein